MTTRHRMPIAVMLTSCLFAATHWAHADNTQRPNSTATLLTQAELIQILPSDADLKNIKRQQKAVKRGLYWTKSKTLRHLDQKS